MIKYKYLEKNHKYFRFFQIDLNPLFVDLEEWKNILKSKINFGKNIALYRKLKHYFVSSTTNKKQQLEFITGNYMYKSNHFSKYIYILQKGKKYKYR